MEKVKKSQKSSTKPAEDINVLKNEIASFASSIGLSSFPSATSGFDDSDFRKPGPSKTINKPPANQKPYKQRENVKGNNDNMNFKQNKMAQPKQNPLDFNAVNNLTKSFDKYKGLPKLPLMKTSALGVWYEDAAELEEKVIGKKKVEFKSVEEWKALVQRKQELGERLMAQFAADYVSSSGDTKMLSNTQRSGTAADKVSAFSIMIADNPVANLRSLDALLGMVTSKVGKRHALTGYDSLRELFVSSLLPDRKLKTLFQRPLNHVPDTKDGHSLLLLWYWEDCLKQRYERFVIALEEASKDVLDALKDKALKTIYVLLRSKSEQERRLLTSLVNKLGDPNSKAASNADYHLLKLLGEHPNMKGVVINEVDTFLFRPHLGMRAKYHAVNFLSQIRLSNNGDGPKIAKRLIEVYFALFKVLISEADKGHKKNKENAGKKLEDNVKDSELDNTSGLHVEMDSRILSALLTGVNRAFPYVASNEADEIVQIQTPILFQLVHSKSFNVGVQALMLLDKISSKNQVISDRFYRALYSKLLLPAAMNSSKEEMFFGLLLRAMKNDINLKRVAAFAKRLLQVSIQQPPQYACGCLFLLSEVLKEKPLWNMMLQREFVDDDLEHFEDVKEDENQASPTTNRTTDTEDTHSDDEIDEECSSLDEDYFDSKDDGQLDDLFLKNGLDEPMKSTPSSDLYKFEAQTSNGSLLIPGGYNIRHREPSFCNADRVSWWELIVLASHAHPSVATMARTLLSGANIVYNGNPLNDLSLTAFLDKFMEKKPKQSTWHGASDIQPVKKTEMNFKLFGKDILSLAETDVPPEDLVFHKFYVNKMKSSKKPKKKKNKDEDDVADELLDGYGSDPDEDFAADESDNEELDNILDSTDADLEEYDYDDLDKVADESGDELINDDDDDVVDDADDDDDAVNIPPDVSDGDDGHDRPKKKLKPLKRKTTSPFASLEEYEHLLDDEDEGPKDKPSREKKSKDKKKKQKVSL
ncbi:unnamed protein product [Cuscuta campestris]|uniref:CCAAT-binding factor domain-containing protein n=1 Tax=Cuscuta campestris TaxID=132261 RepID=A0A484KTS6_9ASTE|nr:unnamed protein product [Cuscuta campestris]